MSKLNCSRYVIDDWLGEKFVPCNCPVCGGFIKAFNDVEEKINCKKCGSELIILPEVEEGKEMDYGKICPLKLGNKNIKPKEF